MTKNLNGLLPEELESLYLEVKEIREKVLDLIQPYGYSASQLVSRHFENEIEKFYGKKLLKTKAKGCEHTDDDTKCPVCQSRENES